MKHDTNTGIELTQFYVKQHSNLILHMISILPRSYKGLNSDLMYDQYLGNILPRPQSYSYM